MKILLLSFRSYGDCIIALKLIEYLSSDSNIQIDIFTRPQFEPFFYNNIHVNHVFSNECLLTSRGWTAKLSLISHFRFLAKTASFKKNEYDIVLNNIGDFRENAIGWFSGGKTNMSVRFDKKHHFTNLIKPGCSFLVDKYINIPNNIINIYDIQKYIAENILQAKIAAKILPTCNNRTKTAIHPAASVKCKFWEYKNWVELIERIYKNDKILIFCTKNEKAEVEAAFIKIADKVEIVVEEIQVFLKKLEKVKVFIGLDSFSIHAAYYKNVPYKIMLNGANDAKIWAPPNTKVVEMGYKCKYHPCYNKPKCIGKSFEYICMKAIKAEYIANIFDNIKTKTIDKSSPSIAILLAAYNGKKYIKEQINTILKQEDVNTTIFISIDTSTDNTREYLEKLYKNNRSVILLNDDGRFGNATKNFMRLIRDVDFSHYDFISFADQDDIWYPNKLSRAVQMIDEQKCFGYSSNVLAFWESGKEKMIVKSQPQVKYDYLFEAAGAGCTYVMAKKLAQEFKKCVIKNFNNVSDLWSHDWFCYAFARANGFKWYIDDFCSMRYRQHENNQMGANNGFAAFKNRVKAVLFDNAFGQSLKIANLTGLKNNRFVIMWSKFSRLDMVKLAFHANQCRRRLRDKILFFTACILLAIVSKKDKKMKVCVVGGAGYIGSHTVYELIDAGHEVVVVDNLSTGLKEAVHKEALFYEGDITDFASLDKIVADENRKKPFDVVMHFAAKIVVPESVKNPSLYYYNNVEGVRTLLDVMVKHNIKNIIFSSTAAVYGEAKDGVCSEESETKPINPYGETKLTSEKMIGWFANAYGMNYCIFRYFNVAGAHKTLEIGLLRDNLTHIVPVTIQTALGIREKLTVFGADYDTPDGTCIRDYVHVSDIAYAHVLGMKHIVEKNVSEIINLGSNQGFSVKNIISEVEKHYPVNYEYGDRREGDPAKLIASNERAKEILGWMPKRELSDIILSDLEFRKRHKK